MSNLYCVHADSTERKPTDLTRDLTSNQSGFRPVLARETALQRLSVCLQAAQPLCSSRCQRSRGQDRTRLPEAVHSLHHPVPACQLCVLRRQASRLSKNPWDGRETNKLEGVKPNQWQQIPRSMAPSAPLRLARANLNVHAQRTCVYPAGARCSSDMHMGMWLGRFAYKRSMMPDLGRP